MKHAESEASSLLLHSDLLLPLLFDSEDKGDNFFPETSVDFFRGTRSYIPKDRIFQNI
jgi:hypothetical protein